MTSQLPHDAHLWPLLLYAALVVLMASGMLLISHFLGQRHEEPATDEIYESGIPVTVCFFPFIFTSWPCFL